MKKWGENNEDVEKGGSGIFRGEIDIIGSEDWEKTSVVGVCNHMKPCKPDGTETGTVSTCVDH